MPGAANPTTRPETSWVHLVRITAFNLDTILYHPTSRNARSGVRCFSRSKISSEYLRRQELPAWAVEHFASCSAPRGKPTGLAHRLFACGHLPGLIFHLALSRTLEILIHRSAADTRRRERGSAPCVSLWGDQLVTISLGLQPQGQGEDT